MTIFWDDILCFSFHLATWFKFFSLVELHIQFFVQTFMCSKMINFWICTKNECQNYLKKQIKIILWVLGMIHAKAVYSLVFYWHL
jgi:hypothetical protein